jgi:hypothetical protein
MKLLEHLGVIIGTGFLLWDKLNSYTSFSIPEESSHILQAVGTVLGLFSLGYIHVMTSHALSFCFRTKVITPQSSFHVHFVWHKEITVLLFPCGIQCEYGTKSATQTTHTNRLTTCKAVQKLIYSLLPILGLQWTQSYRFIFIVPCIVILY